ncbi:MAG: YibE/F family protein, partial [Peptococcaceae bacterium]|nr:YibE/F family protein [Peptococcaceae bacterium]
DETIYLVYLNLENPLNLKAVLFAGILIGALGAMLDTAVSIASALMEVYETAERPSFCVLLRSGLNIGGDTMGTMTSTLILAYMGGSLSLVLILIVYSNSLLELFNREMIVVEILQSLAGSMGLLAATPLTALAAAYIYTRRNTRRNIRRNV